MKNKKAQLSLFFTFVVLAIIIVLLTGLIAPMGALINTEFYSAGEDILQQANESIEKINDETVKASIATNIEKALDQTEENIEISTDLYQYSWIFLVILIGFVLFLLTRRLVEFGGGGLI